MIHRLALIGDPPEARDHVGPGIAPVIHPEARIEAFVTVDAGVESATTIGEAFLMKGCHVGHDAQIGDGCEFAPHVIVGGYCEIGQDVKIGMGAIIRNRVKIGDGARIGFGAVITKDVPAHEIWVGNPGRNIDTDPRVDILWDDWFAARDQPR
jgi:UDP-N-acetylglucosamine acyltransferase